MDQEIIDNARAKVSNILGEKLASKASEAFCLAFARPTEGLGLESAGAMPKSAIIEFTHQPQVSAEIKKKIEKVRKSKAWASVRNALKKIELESVTSGVTT